MIDKPVAASRIYYGDSTLVDLVLNPSANVLKTLRKTNVQAIALKYTDGTARILHGNDFYWRVSANDWHQTNRAADVPTGATRFDGLLIADATYLAVMRSALIWLGMSSEQAQTAVSV